MNRIPLTDKDFEITDRGLLITNPDITYPQITEQPKLKNQILDDTKLGELQENPDLERMTMTYSEIKELKEEVKDLWNQKIQMEKYGNTITNQRDKAELIVQKVRKLYKYGLPTSLKGCAELAVKLKEILGDVK